MPVTRIGFVGLGKMGSEMASNLVEAGFTVQGYDVFTGASE
jgi:3-hydroxyisobutyrate dehydrogenase-like beta-hydroxyacid dehydrogenase